MRAPSWTKRCTLPSALRTLPPLGSPGVSPRANRNASTIAIPAPTAGSSVASSETPSPGRTPTVVSVPASTSAAKLTALVIRKSAAWRPVASSAGTPSRVITSAPSAGPPAPPAGSSTFAPCSANPSTSARRHGITRSNADHRARTKPSIESSEHSAASAIQPWVADDSRSRISPTPGSVRISATAIASTTTKNAARLTAPPRSTPRSVVGSGGLVTPRGWQGRAAKRYMLDGTVMPSSPRPVLSVSAVSVQSASREPRTSGSSAFSTGHAS